RVNSLRIPVPWQRKGAADGRAWAAIAHAVMRRPVLVAVATSAVLLLLASPFLRAKFGGFDERVLPPGAESRVVTEQLRSDFVGAGSSHVFVLVNGGDASTAATVSGQLAALPHVTGVQPVGAKAGSTLLSATFDAP